MAYNLKDSLNKDFQAENPTLYHLSQSQYDTMLPVLEDLWSKLLDKGFTKEQAAGIIGNAILESKLDSSLRGGIFQFRGPNLKYFNSHYPDYSLDNQIDFLLKWKDGEMKEPEGWYHDTTRAYNKSDHSTPEASAQAFYTTFEKANNGTDKLRQNYARRVYDYFASKNNYLDFFQSGGVASNRTYKQRVKENAQTLWEKIKTNPYVNMFVPLEDFSEGNYLAAVPYMIPGEGPVKQTLKTIAHPIRNGLPKVKPSYTIEELLSQGKTRALRTVKDAEYQEALQKIAKDQSKTISQAQLEAINDTKLDLSTPTESGLMETFPSVIPSKTGYLSVPEAKQYLKSIWKVNSDSELYTILKACGQNQMVQALEGNVPITRVSRELLDGIKSGKYSDDYVRRSFFHETNHAWYTNGLITTHNNQYPVKIREGIPISKELEAYYLSPSELRVRSLSARRLRQTTGKSYEEILDTWDKVPHRDDPNMWDLVNLYDRESLLNYLNGFLKEGGTINYLDFFKK